MKTYTLSEARQNFSELIESTQKNGEQFTITVNGKTAATILSSEDYENLLETLEIMGDQEVLRDIAAAEKEYKEEKIISLADL